MWHGEFRDPRLVEVYDAQCPWSRDDDFFMAVVAETPAARVLDFGCGTGRLALALAGAGHTVTGIDPARASLAAARRKPDSARVTWIEGRADSLPTAAFTVALMTSHVGQFLCTDDEWRRTLADLGRALRPGGRLVFDTRDPFARAWERWNPVDSERQVTLADGRVVVSSTEVTAVAAGLVSFTHHYRFPGGEQIDATAELRFRTEDEVRAALADAGFSVDAIFGGWQREPVGQGDGELLVLARRARRG